MNAGGRAGGRGSGSAGRGGSKTSGRGNKASTQPVKTTNLDEGLDECEQALTDLPRRGEGEDAPRRRRLAEAVAAF